MMKRTTKWLVPALLAASLAACGGMTTRDRDTLVGAGVGTAIGAGVTGDVGGAAVGGVVGGVIGNQVGKDHDDDYYDNRRYYRDRY
jgi:osmotically inducible lipoprotein OsmB